jgi:hypothetical protein
MLQVKAQTLMAEIRMHQERMEAEIAATCHKFQTQLKEVEAEAKRGRGTRISVGVAKPPKFDGTTPWAMFRCQFETVAEHNCWTCQEKSTYLISTLQGWVTDMLQGVLKGVTLEALEDCFGDQHLAPAYRSQLKTRTQGVGKSSKNLPQLAYRSYPTLLEDHIRRETGKAFTDRVEDPATKIQMLLLGEDSERGSQAGPQTAGHAPRSQAPQDKHQDILGELITPHRAKRPKTISVMDLWGARSLLG